MLPIAGFSRRELNIPDILGWSLHNFKIYIVDNIHIQCTDFKNKKKDKKKDTQMFTKKNSDNVCMQIIIAYTKLSLRNIYGVSSYHLSLPDIVIICKKICI